MSNKLAQKSEYIYNLILINNKLIGFLLDRYYPKNPDLNFIYKVARYEPPNVLNYYILLYKIDPYKLDQKGNSILTYACMYNHLPTIEYILYTYPQLKLEQKNIEGVSNLLYVFRYNRLCIIKHAICIPNIDLCECICNASAYNPNNDVLDFVFSFKPKFINKILNYVAGYGIFSNFMYIKWYKMENMGSIDYLNLYKRFLRTNSSKGWNKYFVDILKIDDFIKIVPIDTIINMIMYNKNINFISYIIDYFKIDINLHIKNIVTYASLNCVELVDLLISKYNCQFTYLPLKPIIYYNNFNTYSTTLLHYKNKYNIKPNLNELLYFIHKIPYSDIFNIFKLYHYNIFGYTKGYKHIVTNIDYFSSSIILPDDSKEYPEYSLITKNNNTIKCSHCKRKAIIINVCGHYSCYKCINDYKCKCSSILNNLVVCFK
jgi:hypothetical protein